MSADRPSGESVYIYVSFILLFCGLWFSGTEVNSALGENGKSNCSIHDKSHFLSFFSKDELFAHMTGVTTVGEIEGFWYSCLMSFSGIYAYLFYLFILMAFIFSAIRFVLPEHRALFIDYSDLYQQPLPPSLSTHKFSALETLRCLSCPRCAVLSPTTTPLHLLLALQRVPFASLSICPYHSSTSFKYKLSPAPFS